MNSSGPRALVVGEALVDIVLAASGRELARAAGGSPLNVAVGLARLGVPVTLATDIGDDDLGALVREHATASGVALAPGSVGERPTGTAVARLNAAGVASYEFSLRWEVRSPALSRDLGVLHVGSLGTMLEPGASTLAGLVDSAVRLGVPVSYDPNVRPAISPDGAAAWRIVRQLAERCAVVKLSAEDIDHLQPGRDMSAVLEELVSGAKTKLAVCTLGAGGALALSAAAEVRVDAPTVDVVDTVGAGDSFMAAMLAVLFEHGALASEARPLDQTALAVLLRASVAAAAITCARHGADPPRRAELGPSWP